MAGRSLPAFSYYPASSFFNLQRRSPTKLWVLGLSCGRSGYGLQDLTSSRATLRQQLTAEHSGSTINNDTHPCILKHLVPQDKVRLSRIQPFCVANSGGGSPNEVVASDFSNPEMDPVDAVSMSLASAPIAYYGENGGKPGFISFYATPLKRDDTVSSPGLQNKQNGLLWFVGPTVLVASFIFPSLYLRKIISTIFEDSLLTDFLILFFVEALFYFGVALFLTLMDRLWRSSKAVLATRTDWKLTSQLSYRISSVTILVLSLIIPLVTMGFVWPWTGPAASATLAPYLVGIVVQFAFEQYAKYIKSPSWPAIPIIFQVYRLHQLNRAAQLVTALSFTVKGAEMTSHNAAINSSLGTLLNVLQLLGVICIWSLSCFLVRFFPSAAVTQ